VCAGDTCTRPYRATTAIVMQFLLLGRVLMAGCQDDTTEISGWLMTRCRGAQIHGENEKDQDDLN
jgi:hypothetical protein